MIRARDGDCVPGLPPGPSGRSRIIRIPGARLCDLFTRSVSGGLGTGPAGTWTKYGSGSDLDTTVDGEDAIITVYPNNGWYPGEYYIEPGRSQDRLPLELLCEFEFEMSPYPIPDGRYLQFFLNVGDTIPTSYFNPLLTVEVSVFGTRGGDEMDVFVTDDRGHYHAANKLAAAVDVNGVRMMLRWVIDGAGTRTRLWKVADSEPATWHVDIANSTAVLPGRYFAFDTNASANDTKTIIVGSLCWL